MTDGPTTGARERSAGTRRQRAVMRRVRHQVAVGRERPGEGQRAGAAAGVAPATWLTSGPRLSGKSISSSTRASGTGVSNGWVKVIPCPKVAVADGVPNVGAAAADA